MKKGGFVSRVLVALWGIPLILSLTWMGGWWTFLLIACISLWAQLEYYRLMVKLGYRPLRLFGLVMGLVVLVSWESGGATIPWILAVISMTALLATISPKFSHRDSLITFGGICYPPLLAGTFIVIRGWIPSDGDVVNGARMLALCFWGALWICDTAAMLGGRYFGRHALAPVISPKKTIEGFLFGLFGSVAFTVVWWWLDFVPLDLALAIGLAAGLFGQMGDLVESVIKREAGVKDSADLLPGHGGMLDRFDGLFLAAPIVAMYLSIRSVLIYL